MKRLALLNSIISLTWMAIGLMIILLVMPAFISSNKEVPETAKTIDVVPATVIDDALAETYALGKTLFKLNCASCHNKNMVDDMTGPALSGVKDRWSDFPEKDLYDWIKNSNSLIEKGHPRAVEVWEEWDKATMNAFLNLTDEEVEAIVVYIEVV